VSIDSFVWKCQNAGMKDSPSDPRQQAILTAAWAAFATYGYRKTSMDDIARGAGMSRPALYLHYRNKQDIFRSLAQAFYDQATEAVIAALEGGGSAASVLTAAFAAQGGEVTDSLLTSPHGMELLDTTGLVAMDIVQAGEQRLREIYAAWLKRQAAAGRVQFTGTPEDVAGTMTAALKGIKMAGIEYATYKIRVAQLAALIGAGLDAA
jgi:AcrR family transcriptional regulator